MNPPSPYPSGSAPPRLNSNAAPPLGSSLYVLTLTEAARELRCSRTYLDRILAGRVSNLPPLPVFNIGCRVLIRSNRKMFCHENRLLH